MADMHSSNRSSSETAASPAYESATGAQNLPADEIPVPETHTDHIESLRQPLDDTLHTYNSVLHSDVSIFLGSLAFCRVADVEGRSASIRCLLD